MKPWLKRVLSIAAALAVLIYIGFQVYHFFAIPVVTVTAEPSIAYDTVEVTGVAVRNETVIRSQQNGYLFYTVENGGRVAKQGTIATVYPSETDAIRQQELDRLDEEIENLNSINAQGTSNRASLGSINQQVSDTWMQISSAARSSSFSEIAGLKSRLLTLLNKKQLTIGRETDFDARIAALQQERKTLAGSFHAATGTVNAPTAGYFISKVDGYEPELTVKEVTAMTAADIDAAIAFKPTAAAQEGLGKIVSDYEWYLACVLPLERTVSIKKGLELEVCLPFVQNEPIPMRVVAINKEGDRRAAVILQCTRMSEALSVIRCEQVEIRLRKFEGIQVPDSAIYFNENEEPGVYVQLGNLLRFRRIESLHHDETAGTTLCAIGTEKGTLRLYDRIVIKGENLYDGKSTG